MQKKKIYSNTDSMASLICDNYSMLTLMSRFNIKLGFGGKTIGQVCSDNKININNFLAVANLLLNREELEYEAKIENISIPSLVAFLRESHRYFLDSRIPTIRKELTETLAEDKISTLILRYYDDYVEEIRTHMCYEDDNVFPYVEQLTKGNLSQEYNIDTFAARHDHINEPLNEFKDVIIKYYTADNNEDITNIIRKILICADDLEFHNMIEDKILVPLIKKLELSIQNKSNSSRMLSCEELSQREKEIVAAIALGKSNKDIASELFISTHTVMTHRKNIATKLKIHNSAGLTIYAIVNKLIDINDI